MKMSPRPKWWFELRIVSGGGVVGVVATAGSGVAMPAPAIATANAAAAVARGERRHDGVALGTVRRYNDMRVPFV